MTRSIQTPIHIQYTIYDKKNTEHMPARQAIWWNVICETEVEGKRRNKPKTNNERWAEPKKVWIKRTRYSIINLFIYLSFVALPLIHLIYSNFIRTASDDMYWLLTLLLLLFSLELLSLFWLCLIFNVRMCSPTSQVGRQKEPVILIPYTIYNFSLSMRFEVYES